MTTTLIVQEVVGAEHVYVEARQEDLSDGQTFLEKMKRYLALSEAVNHLHPDEAELSNELKGKASATFNSMLEMGGGAYVLDGSGMTLWNLTGEVHKGDELKVIGSRHLTEHPESGEPMELAEIQLAWEGGTASAMFRVDKGISARDLLAINFLLRDIPTPSTR